MWNAGTCLLTKVYRSDIKKYRYFNKYAGRQINSLNFKQSLLNFLDNGVYYLIGLIPLILKRLESLVEAISTMPTFRFYASSLLMIYDGEPNASASPDITIKMVDFANCVANADQLFATPGLVSFPPTKPGPDSGYLLGLRTLMTCFKEIFNDLQGDGGDSHVLIKSLSNTKRANVRMGL
jgi:Inositol polyphosphate kinase